MLCVSLSDHINNQALRRMSGFKDIVIASRETKFVGWDTLLALLTTSGRHTSLAGIHGKKTTTRTAYEEMARIRGGDRELHMKARGSY